MALGHHLLSEVRGLPIALESKLDRQLLTQSQKHRAMASVEPLEHITQENFTSSDSTAVSVIYKSDSIFEQAATRKSVVQDYLKDYMPKANTDMA